MYFSGMGGEAYPDEYFGAADLNWQKEKQMINDDFLYGTLFWEIENADMFDSSWIMD